MPSLLIGHKFRQFFAKFKKKEPKLYLNMDLQTLQAVCWLYKEKLQQEWHGI
jgi:hypothetical protein